VPNSVLNVLYRKVHDAPFKVGLEVATAAAVLTGNEVFDSEYIERPPAPPRPTLLRRVLRRLAG
jgi:hypothetical protein